jgi:hypothetical protein
VTADTRLVELEAEERYARERYQLYKARAYGSRLTSAARLRELEQRSRLATGRLNRAKSDREPVVDSCSSAPEGERSGSVGSI